jgi:hypothetical protein
VPEADDLQSDAEHGDELNHEGIEELLDTEDDALAGADNEIDLEETVLIHETDDKDVEESPAPSEDTVLIHPGDDSIMYLGSEDDDDLLSIAPQSPTPETLVWENIRQDVTIPVDFDVHLAQVGSLPHPPSLGFQDDYAPFGSADTVVDAEQDELGFETNADLIQKNPETDIVVEFDESHEDDTEEPVADASVKLDDFIDVAALAESTQIMQIPDPVPEQAAAVEVVRGNEADLGNANEDSEADDILTNTEEHFENLEHVDIATVEDQQLIETEEASILDSLHVEVPSSENCIDELAAEQQVPHYALPTFAFDVRRKSVPAVQVQTPIKIATRPNTSDGSGLGHVVNPFTEPRILRSRSRANSTVATSLKTPSRATIGAQAPSATPVTRKSAAVTPIATPGERYPRLGARKTYEEHAKTVTVPTRFRTPVSTPAKRPTSVQKPNENVVTTRASTLRPRPVTRTPKMASGVSTPAQAPASSVKTPSVASAPATGTPGTVTPSERFPRLSARNNYAAHAKTVAAPSRFRTPAQTSPKRPETISKQGSLRKVALTNATPMKTKSRTPMKTPLKPPQETPVSSTPAPAMTPGQPPMTPHPAAPLRGILALVEVYTLEGASASAPFVALLHRLGAKTTKSWSERVTHVIFKDGSPTTLQKVRLHNKDVLESGKAEEVFCVNSRWVSACDEQGTRLDEADEYYAVDVNDVPRGGGRRRKSMEPSALVNLGGGIIRERRSSLSRTSISLSRSPLKIWDLPVKGPETPVEEKENSPKLLVNNEYNEAEDDDEPATPAYLKEPDKLVQQTAPINRMRKLGLKGKDKAAERRRLTFAPGKVGE